MVDKIIIYQWKFFFWTETVFFFSFFRFSFDDLVLCTLAAENRISEAIFFYIPIAVIFLVNTILFGLTAIKIKNIQKDLVVAAGNDELHRHRHQKKLNKQRDKYVVRISWLFRDLYFYIERKKYS